MQSFELELQETLRPLLPLLPPDKSTALSEYLTKAKEEDNPQIPYVFLKEISSWAQTNLNSEVEYGPSPERYTMIALLAGSVASPRSQFPAPEPRRHKGHETISQSTKEVTALLNCAVTIIGAGLAAWFASSRAGWRNEWRILFAILSSAAVAFIEVALYIAWTTRAEQRAARKRAARAISKKADPPIETSGREEPLDSTTTRLRKRRNNLIDG